MRRDETMNSTVAHLLTQTKDQLDQLFASSQAGPVPSGEAKGTAIIDPGTAKSAEIAKLINLFAWQGKVFDPQSGTLRNHITPFGLKAIIAKVYKGPSLLDKKDCVVLDYSDTSLVAHWIRDEIRLIAPNTYLGKVYWDNAPLIHFALEFQP
jgi:hypothetical protein